MAPETAGFAEEGGGAVLGEPGFESRRTHWAYAYGAQAAWVAVDRETGEARALKIITVSDVGETLNPRAVEGQQEGGVMMGVGYALSEEFPVLEGRSTIKSLKACGLPRADRAPEIINVTVEVPHPWGPFGAKGLAEAPSLATAPAVTAAIYDAVGTRVYDLPVKPEKTGANNESAD